MEGVLEGETQADETGDHERGRDPNGLQPDLGLEVTFMFVDVTRGDEVVEPVAADLAQQGGHDGGEVKVADLEGTKVVKGREED